MNCKKLEEIIIEINDNLLTNHPLEDTVNGFESSCFYLGALEAYDILKKKEYFDSALAWANHNGWKKFDPKNVFPEDLLYKHFTDFNRCDWEFENWDDYEFIHADFYTCGQVYIRLREFNNQLGTLDYMIKAAEFTINEPHNDYWWWVDSIYMALPFYHKLAVLLDDERYAVKGDALYQHCKNIRRCYDEEEHLWYRDERYMPKNALTANGEKIFWSRGNGWVYAGLARTLDVLDKNSPYYTDYAKTFCEMTPAILNRQNDDGFWRCSLNDPNEYPMPETSGTVLFLYGLLMGIKLGLVNSSYLPRIEKSIEQVYETAVFPGGKLGWVQDVAEKPGIIEKDTTRDYAVGCYTLACCELYRMKREPRA